VKSLQYFVGQVISLKNEIPEESDNLPDPAVSAQEVIVNKKRIRVRHESCVIP
jgi:hypothetical protein